MAASTGDGRGIQSALIVPTHLGLWPAPAHSPPFAGYPLPSAQQRVAPREGVRSVQGTRDHPAGARGRRGLPDPPPPGVRLSLDSLSSSPDTPARPRRTRVGSLGTPRSGRRAHPRRARGPEIGRHRAAPPKNKFHLTWITVRSIRQHAGQAVRFSLFQHNQARSLAFRQQPARRTDRKKFPE